MCDYSLHGIRNRLAEEGEVLVVHRFFTGSKGLTSPEYLKPTAQPRGLLTALKKFFAAEPQACAVCVPGRGKTHGPWHSAKAPGSAWLERRRGRHVPSAFSGGAYLQRCR